MAKQFTLELPDNTDIDAAELKMILATQLYAKGMLSIGHAAALAAMEKRAFMEKLGSYGVSVFNHPASDLEQDVKNAASRNK